MKAQNTFNFPFNFPIFYIGIQSNKVFYSEALRNERSR
jgi:hypothetical protein